MSYNKPVLHRIKKINQETPTIKSFQFQSSRIAKTANPGQFVMVWVPGVDEFPMSISSVSDSKIEIAVSKKGEGTTALHQKQTDDLVGLRGPFGNNFNLKGRNVCAVLGGCGSAPGRFLIENSKDSELTVLLGAVSSNEFLYKNELEKISRIKIATDDGSEGHKGFVTDLLPKLFKQERFDQVIACGPEAMLKRVCEITTKYKIPTQVCVERIVKCADGFCGSCAIGEYRTCKEGPVFDKDKIYGKTEFARWTRDKSGRRVTINGITNDNFTSSAIMEFTPLYDAYLETEICGIKLPNPLMNCSGMGVSGQYFYRVVVEGGTGAIATKSIGLEPREGYPGPNFINHNVNAMGLPNPGIRNYGAEIEDMRKSNVPIFLSLFGETPEECKKVADIAVNYGINAIEQNISCPHTSLGSVEKNPELVKEIIEAVVSIAHTKNIPVSVKISANVDYIEVAKAAVEGGVDMITAINTRRVREINSRLNIPILGSAGGYGGLSGRKIRKLSEQVLEDLYSEFDVPIISVGGIESEKDIIRRFEKGASACQIGTATTQNGFDIYRKLNLGLRDYLVANCYDNVKEIIGIKAN